MSFKLAGSDTQKKSIGELALQISKNATKFPYVETLPVDLPSIKGNRKTSASTIFNMLKSEGGFNPGLWRFPNVLKTSIAEGKRFIQSLLDEGMIEDGGYDHEVMKRGFINGAFYLRWDGDHRHKHWKAHYFPESLLTGEFIDSQVKYGSYECMVYEVPEVSVGNLNFVKIQKQLAKSLTPDDTWVNLYLAGDKETLKQAKNMEKCRVGVKDSNGEIYPNKANNGLWVRSRLFTEFVNKFGFDNVLLAINDCEEILSNKPNWNKELYDTAYGGMAALYNARPDASRNGLNKKIKDMLSKSSSSMSKKNFIDLYKSKGGNQHNKEAESFALGVARLFCDAVNEGLYGSNKNQTNPLKISRLFEDLKMKGEDNNG